MEFILEDADKIMERVLGKIETRESNDRKENSISTTDDSAISNSPIDLKMQDGASPLKWTPKVLTSKTNLGEMLRENNVDGDLDDKTSLETEGKKNRSAQKARFSALAEEYENFEVDSNHQSSYMKPKEVFMKGTSPRLSVGEIRPSVLCSPAGIAQTKQSNIRKTSDSMSREASPQKPATATVNKTSLKLDSVQEESRRIRFAYPLAATSVWDDDSAMYSTINTVDESSIMAGCGVNQSVQSLPGQTGKIFTKEDQENMSSDEYGAHTFMKKKTPTKVTSSSSVKMCSPKPFVFNASQIHHSPVQFNPTTTSSPNMVETKINVGKSMVTELPLTASENNSISSRGDVNDELQNNMQFEGKASIKSLESEHSSEPQTEDSKTVVSKWTAIDSVKAKTIAFQQKLDNTHIKIPTPKSVAGVQFHDSVTPSCPVGIQTQWRGGNNTSIIYSNPAQLTKVNIRANNLKNLKNRWEFSSLTGTPLHPDETEDDLLKTAIRMRDTVIPRKETNSAVKMVTSVTNISPPRSAKKKFLECCQSSSPVAKSLRYEQEDLFENAGSSQQNTKKSPNLDIVSHKGISHTNETGMAEEYSADNEVSSDEMDMSQNVSRFIDKAFDFMDRSPTKSFETPRATTQEEFTSLMNDTSSENVMENHSTLVTSNTALIDQETNDSSDNACRLPYTVSFYRKRLREKRIEDGFCQKIELTSNIANIPTQHVIGGVHHEEDNVDIENNKATLEREITVQQQRIAQASRALLYCKEQLEFRGSREEVDAQRALLIATETRRALIFEIEKLNREEIKRSYGPRGALTISHIIINLNRDFINTHANYGHGSDDIYYFIVLLKCGENVQSTTLLTSDDGIRKKGALEFNHYLTLKNLPPDFVCTLEVYGLRTRREQISHEEKYRLKGTAGRSKAQKMSTLASGGGPLAVVDPSFQLIGRLPLDIQSASRKMFTLQDPLHPLDGGIMVKIKKYATDKTNLSHRGFLSMYQRTKEGLGSWTRYWCVLNCGEMKFWRSPEDDANNKSWLVLLDLQTCAGDGASTVRDICPYPNSFHIDVWVPKEIGHVQRQGCVKPEMEKLRVMLAADTKNDLQVWLDIINQTARHLLMWDRHSSLAKQ